MTACRYRGVWLRTSEARDGRPMKVYHCKKGLGACDKYVMRGCGAYAPVRADGTNDNLLRGE